LSRIEKRFSELAERGDTALIPYIVAGDPDLQSTVPLMHALVEAGADLIELGVPFSDPMAEGEVIQQAHERALERRVSLKDALAAVAEFRKQDADTPVLLMGYANPVESMGRQAFVDAAAESGLDALLTVDLPPEEAADLDGRLRAVQMNNIFLVAPTTPADRVEKIAEMASGFVYYVALKGVTGAGNLDTAEVARNLSKVRAVCDLPIAVGFGIKDPASAAAVARVADGVVVGSALVKLLADVAAQGADTRQVCEAAATMVTAMREAIDAR
jgi:tryptophan synthase alpha chain